jgi:hypothetical protein
LVSGPAAQRGISHLIRIYIGVQQTAADGVPQAQPGYAEDTQKGRMPPGDKDAIYGWTLSNLTGTGAFIFFFEAKSEERH